MSSRKKTRHPQVPIIERYRGHDYLGSGQVHITGQRRNIGPALRKRKKRRAAIEPKIGHLKSDNRMNRNFLSKQGDKINALLAGIGANLRKLLTAFWHALSNYLWNCLQSCQFIPQARKNLATP